MSDNTEDLQKQIADLTARVWRLEQALGERPASQATGSPIATDSLRPLPIATTATPAHPDVPVVVEDRKPRSLENRIGSQLFNRICIIALLIGMAWFLKFAIDNHWIGPLSRVLIGLASGIGVIVWSERFRIRGYWAF